MELITSISALVAIWSAIYGITVWRKEYQGKKRIDLAEETLALFYEALDALNHMRSPASFGAEREDVEKIEGETEEQFSARQNASVVYYRHNQHSDLFSKMWAARYRFMAEIGKEKATPFVEFNRLVREVLSAATVLSRIWPRDYFPDDASREKHFNQVRKFEAIFWEGFNDPDPIKERLSEAISEIEDTCRDVIEGKSSMVRKAWKRLTNHLRRTPEGSA